MKKSLLFVIDSLDCAGAEKSLVTLLSLLDYSKFSVDMMLFAHGKLLEELLPKEVNILKPLVYTKFSELSMKNSLIFSLKSLSFRMLFSRLKYSVAIRRRKYSNPQKSRIFWQSVSNVIEINPKLYDVAISYAQGIPSFYVIDKIHAKKKVAWVNVSCQLRDKERLYHKQYYDQFDKVVAVSDSTKDTFIQCFPEYSEKTKVIYDINNPEFINRMSCLGKSYDDHYDGLRILTIGRLARQKGYDIALQTCKMLKEHGVEFRWYALGKGPLKEEIEQYIRENDLSRHFILLGVESNPYPYIKQSDLYVQTSKFEGFGLAIAEARMLNVPVVTTRFDAVYNQMIDGINGLVVDMNADAVYVGILKIINDVELRESIIGNLKVEKKGNVEEINNVYQLIG